LARLLDGGEIEAVDSEELSAQLSTLLEGLRELAAQLRQMAGTIQHDPREIQRLQDRFDEILRLERKYDCPADELAALLSEKQARLALLTDDSQSPEVLESQVREAETQVAELAAQLTKKRTGAARQLEKSTFGYFKRLDFPHVALQVELTAAEQPGPQGQDQVELLISLNPGEPARPLARVASGGEASRLLLGLKAALADRLGHSALLLDEVEAGVGGDTARKVADVLVELSATRQVLAITHLPGVAARGALHLIARKRVSGGRSGVEFLAVSGQPRREELARMLGEAGGAEEQALVDKLLSGAE
jgi:DNA repair protein RecN (Recombination protein N)